MWSNLDNPQAVITCTCVGGRAILFDGGCINDLIPLSMVCGTNIGGEGLSKANEKGNCGGFKLPEEFALPQGDPTWPVNCDLVLVVREVFNDSACCVLLVSAQVSYWDCPFWSGHRVWAVLFIALSGRYCVETGLSHGFECRLYSVG